MDGDAVRSAHGLCRAAADTGAGDRSCAAEAHGVVARRGARGAGAAGRAVAMDWSPLDEYLIDYRRRAVDEADGVRVEFCRRPGTGARRPSRSCTSKRRSRRFIFAKRAAATAVPDAMAAPELRRMWKKETEPMANVGGDARDRSATRSSRSRRRGAEELRLLEALLFAAEATARRESLGEAAAGRRRRARRCWRNCRRTTRSRGVNLVRVGSKWTLPHRERSGLADDAREHGDAQTVARRDRDARDRRLSPAGDARRDRGNPRRDHVQGHARRAARNRLDPAARPPQGAGPAGDLRHQRGLPVAFRAGGARRSARPRRAQGRGPCRCARCRPASAFRCRPTIRRCARTRIRSNRAISTSAWRRAAEPHARNRTLASAIRLHRQTCRPQRLTVSAFALRR